MVCRECNVHTKDGACNDCKAVRAALAKVIPSDAMPKPGNLGQWIADARHRGVCLITLAKDWVFYPPKTGRGFPGDHRRAYIQRALEYMPVWLSAKKG